MGLTVFLCHQKEASIINAVPWSEVHKQSGSLWSARKALLQFSQILTEPPKYHCIQKDPIGERATKSLYTVCCVWRVRWWGPCNEVPATELFSNEIMSSWLLHWKKKVLLKLCQGFCAAEGLGVRDRKGSYNLKEMLSRKHICCASLLWIQLHNQF